MASLYQGYWRLITVQSNDDDDDDRNITVSDKRSSFDLKYGDDDDVRRHWIENDGVMTI